MFIIMAAPPRMAPTAMAAVACGTPAWREDSVTRLVAVWVGAGTLEVKGMPPSLTGVAPE